MSPDTEIISHEHAGSVLLRRSYRAKYMRITVKGDCSVQVTVPPTATFRQARKFFISRQDWVLRQLQRMKTLRDERSVKNTLPDIIDRVEARRLLTGRLEALSNKFGLPFNRLSFKNQKTIWGSCSGRNNISLNYKLHALPPHLQDYVLAHELVHTVVKNHSQEFWAVLEKKIPAAKALGRELKTYRLR